MGGFIPHRHPYLVYAQVLIWSLRSITLTDQRRQFLSDLKSSLELPINGGAVGITKEKG